MLNALKHPGTKSTCCNEIRNKYGTEKKKFENQDYSLTSREVMFGGFRGFGGTCSAYPIDECTKFLSNYSHTTKHALPDNRQAQKYYNLRQATSSKLNAPTHTVNINSPRDLPPVFFSFCVSTKNATSFIS
jgi:hypothetical protein